MSQNPDNSVRWGVPPHHSRANRLDRLTNLHKTTLSVTGSAGSVTPYLGKTIPRDSSASFSEYHPGTVAIFRKLVFLTKTMPVDSDTSSEKSSCFPATLWASWSIWSPSCNPVFSWVSTFTQKTWIEFCFLEYYHLGFPLDWEGLCGAEF